VLRSIETDTVLGLPGRNAMTNRMGTNAQGPSHTKREVALPFVTNGGCLSHFSS